MSVAKERSSNCTGIVESCHPQPDELDKLILELNSSRGFYTFIKRLRGAFRGVVLKEKRA